MGLLQSHDRHRRGDGKAALIGTGVGGRLAGIGRRSRPHGEIELIDHVHVSRTHGVAQDFRGALAASKGNYRRQVSLIEAESWAEALADLSQAALHSAEPWWRRRANLLVEGIRLPRAEGTRIRIGAGCLFEVITECNPCHRMEEVAPGLKAALTPGWRGGFLLRVLEDGEIAIGNEVRIEP